MIGSYPADEKMSLKILHDANFRRLKQVNFDIKSRIKHDGKLGMVISCHPDMGSVLITKIDPIGRAKDAGLKVGERVFGINGISLMEVTMTEAIDALKNSKETFKILVQDTKAGRKELEPEPCCLLM
jgi:predicted metalloprotease with PDZ domain